jgi:predicted GIY-YIG superfamily endonuclease
VFDLFHYIDRIKDYRAEHSKKKRRNIYMDEEEQDNSKECETKEENDKNNDKGKPSYVYLLVATGGATYVGATVDLHHRLRQHNKEIKGGAAATSAKVAAGEKWTRACHVAGFPDWRAALQFEWRWKQISRQMLKGETSRLKPLERRAAALKRLLSLDRATSAAQPYSEWTVKPQVNVEMDTALFVFDKSIA